jgi:hypothetical protein
MSAAGVSRVLSASFPNGRRSDYGFRASEWGDGVRVDWVGAGPASPMAMALAMAEALRAAGFRCSVYATVHGDDAYTPYVHSDRNRVRR